MYAPFTTAYEPATLAEFELPELLRDAITAISTTSRLNTLLTGPSGAGKTTMSKTIASNVSGHVSANILLVNTVGDNGISFFRNDVRTFCKSKTTLQKKVVVIDDIDTINDQSQQVLRSCMEIFEDSVQFIATASSEHKLVDGMVSRFTTIRLPPVNASGLERIARKVCAHESVELTPEAIEYLILACERSPRALLRTLDKITLTSQTADYDTCRETCVAVDDRHYNALIEHVQADDAFAALTACQNMCDSGYSPTDILDGFFHSLPRIDGITETQKYRLTKTIARYVATCHSCHTANLQLKLFVLEIFNVIRL
jgi:DNA polymerase III delta prime subunit